jgi:hypothetical protein
MSTIFELLLAGLRESMAGFRGPTLGLRSERTEAPGSPRVTKSLPRGRLLQPADADDARYDHEQERAECDGAFLRERDRGVEAFPEDVSEPHEGRRPDGCCHVVDG